MQGRLNYEVLEAFRKGCGEEERYRDWLGLVENEKWDAGFCSIRG